jgi:hypothetical protein
MGEDRETNPGSTECAFPLDGGCDGCIRGVDVGVYDIDAVFIRECSIRSFLSYNQIRFRDAGIGILTHAVMPPPQFRRAMDVCSTHAVPKP